MILVPHNPTRRRGGVYVLVLSVSMLVMIIGVSAVIALRAKQQTSDLVSDSILARQLARSAVELGSLAIDADDSWRTTWASGVWKWTTTVDGARMGYTAVDETDGDLADDDTDPVRIYGFAEIDNVTRILSVEMAPVVTPNPTNLIGESTFETGIGAWFATGNGVVAQDISKPYAGVGCLILEDRLGAADGVAIDITGAVANGADMNIDFWAMVGGSSDNLLVQINITTDSFGYVHQAASAPTVDTNWSKHSVSLTTTWSGTLVQAVLSITPKFDNKDLYLDDVSMTDAADTGATTALIATAGTWRREVLD